VRQGCLLSAVLFNLSLEFVKTDVNDAMLKSLCKQLKLLYRSIPISTLTSDIMVIYFIILILLQHTGNFTSELWFGACFIYLLFKMLSLVEST